VWPRRWLLASGGRYAGADMTMATPRAWWTALLLAAALVLHLLMLAGVGGGLSNGGASAHGRGVVVQGAEDPSGHGAAEASHDAAQMLSMCFAVLSIIAVGVGSRRVARAQRGAQRKRAHTGWPGLRAGRATCRDGPREPSRIAAGVLLRV